MPRTRRPFRTLLVGSVTAALVATAGPAPAANLAEQFDSIALPGWTKTNLSSPAGSNGWFQGNPMVFPAQAGATNAYIAANINSTTNTNTISNWLITPVFTTLTSTDVLSFYTRTPAGSHFPDRLEVRVSTNGSCSPGSTSTGVGDFTTLLTTINPTLAAGGYPESWTQFTLPLSGVVNPATVGGQATGCLAFRYFVTDGGPAGGNSNYIGIDTVSFADNGPDLTAPIVTITSGPAPRTSSPAPSFAFSANEPATFACRVYAQGATPPAFSPCSGPTGTHTPTANLNDGRYTFDVRATDPSFNTGDATRSFTCLLYTSDAADE